mmetsp:Transcript_33699/g.72882  ORF Transcript_33699/g.72882 Transcript_33699/m.72882 type:complete len:698 (-) Transcript_33699:150-2243(-)
MTVDEINAKHDREEPPPMAEHTPKEFQFAERTLLKMVADSRFFPQRAGCSDWFRPHHHRDRDDNDTVATVAPGAADTEDKNKNAGGKNGSMARRRRRSEEDSITIATASTASTCGDVNTSSNGNRRNTIGCVPTTAAATTEEEEGEGTPSDNNNGLLTCSISSISSYDSAFLSALGLLSPATTATTVTPPTSLAIDDDGMDDRTAPSSRAPPKEYSTVPSIHERDVDYGHVLGLGGFCEVRVAHLRDARNDHRHRYAMKYLSPAKMAPRIPFGKFGTKDGVQPRNKQFERSIADLAIEARFLALLSHPNIISLHYVSEGELETQFNCQEEGGHYRHRFGYFMLLDPLFETLATRIEKTYLPQVFGAHLLAPSDSSSSNSSRNGLWKRMIRRNDVHDSLPMETWRGQLAQRLEGLKGIASALRYLHDDCRVVYRDVKPDNIGFYRKPDPRCHSGYAEIPKLFDFGLAKELKPQYLCASHPLGRPKSNPVGEPSGFDTYKLTARSGSRRYMAPEVALSSPYNERADVYSLGIVLYQVASLVTPFEGYSLYRHEEEVLALGDRPDARIPCKRRSLKKIKRSLGVSYAEWLAGRKRRGEGFEKMNNLLALRTKCVWTEGLRDLIEECWHSNLFLRPSMEDVVERLEGCIRELTATVSGGKSSKSRGSHLSINQETECISSISHGGDSSNWVGEGLHNSNPQ